LFKEFLTSLSKEAFDTNRGLWLSTDENQLYPNPHSYAKECEFLFQTVELMNSPPIKLVWIRMSNRQGSGANDRSDEYWVKPFTMVSSSMFLLRDSFVCPPS
jgi:hypothetical protein